MAEDDIRIFLDIPIVAKKAKLRSEPSTRSAANYTVTQNDLASENFNQLTGASAKKHGVIKGRDSWLRYEGPNSGSFGNEEITYANIGNPERRIRVYNRLIQRLFDGVESFYQPEFVAFPQLQDVAKDDRAANGDLRVLTDQYHIRLNPGEYLDINYPSNVGMWASYYDVDAEEYRIASVPYNGGANQFEVGFPVTTNLHDIKLWLFNPPTLAQARFNEFDVFPSNLYAWFPCEFGLATFLMDKSPNSLPIAGTANPATFYQTGKKVAYPYNANDGYTGIRDVLLNTGTTSDFAFWNSTGGGWNFGTGDAVFPGGPANDLAFSEVYGGPNLNGALIPGEVYQVNVTVTAVTNTLRINIPSINPTFTLINTPGTYTIAFTAAPAVSQNFSIQSTAGMTATVSDIEIVRADRFPVAQFPANNEKTATVDNVLVGGGDPLEFEGQQPNYALIKGPCLRSPGFNTGNISAPFATNPLDPGEDWEVEVMARWVNANGGIVFGDGTGFFNFGLQYTFFFNTWSLYLGGAINGTNAVTLGGSPIRTSDWDKLRFRWTAGANLFQIFRWDVLEASGTASAPAPPPWSGSLKIFSRQNTALADMAYFRIIKDGQTTNWWTFDAFAGNVVYDIVGGNHATITTTNTQWVKESIRWNYQSRYGARREGNVFISPNLINKNIAANGLPLNVPGNQAINADLDLTGGAMTNDALCFNLDDNLEIGEERRRRPPRYSKYSRSIGNYAMDRVLTFDDTIVNPFQNDLNGYTQDVG